MKMKKTLTLILALVLVACLAIGGTLAYFSWTSGEVSNKFVVKGDGGIDVVDPDPTTPEIELEPDWEGEAEIIPGKVYAKDPQVTLGENSFDVWVIFSVEEVNNWIDTDNDGEVDMQIVQWAKSDEVTDVTDELIAAGAASGKYYYAAKVTAGTSDTIQLFQGGDVDAEGQVTINPNLNETTMNLISANGVELVVNAWVLQDVDGTAAGAWGGYVAG